MTITQQEIIALAVEAGLTVGRIAGVDYVVSSKPYDSVAILERFFKAAYQRGVRDEREAAAKICDKYAVARDHAWNEYVRSRECQRAAAAIRARSDK